MPQVVDIEQAVLLLEVEPPFDKRDIQLARRRLAKQWHPDIAPPGKQLEHERHLKAVNEAADQLERLAEDSRGGKVSRNAVKVAGQAARKRRAEEGARAYEEEQRQRAAAAEQPQARSVRLARAGPLGRASLRTLPVLSRVGRGQRQRHLLHGRGRRHPAVGPRELPGRRADRPGRLAAVRGLPQARSGRRARAALHDRGQARAGRGRLQAGGPAARLRARRRPAQPRRAAPAPDRLLAGRRLPGRRPRGARLDPPGARAARRRTGPPRGSTRTWARSPRRSTRPPRRPRPRPRSPRRGSGSAGCACGAFDREGAREALERARTLGASEQGLLDLALVAHLAGDLGAEITACEQATVVAPESPSAWGRYAHALARTDRLTDCLAACERALELGDDPEVRELRDRVLAAAPRELTDRRPPSALSQALGEVRQDRRRNGVCTCGRGFVVGFLGRCTGRPYRGARCVAATGFLERCAQGAVSGSSFAPRHTLRQSRGVGQFPGARFRPLPHVPRLSDAGTSRAHQRLPKDGVAEALRYIRRRRYVPPTMRLIVARCSVEYSGRLSARLPEALRLVMLKADGSVLVHADAGGYKPLNWMTPPTVIEEERRADRGPQAQGRGPAGDHARRGGRRTWTTRWTRTPRALEKDGVEARPAGAAGRRAGAGAARASGSCAASGRPTSGRST